MPWPSVRRRKSYLTGFALAGWSANSLSLLIKRRHPDVQARIDLVYQEHLAKLGKRGRDPAAQDD
jgi:hypothetical protein